MKVLVTGGAGFIGSHVVDGCLRAGHEVVVIDNLQAGKAENINPSARFYRTDIRANKGLIPLDEAFKAERPEVVSHYAAQISVPASVEEPLFDADINIMGLLNVLECSRRHGVRKVIFASTGGTIYGEAGQLPTGEDCPAAPGTPYAIAKLLSEHYLGFYKNHYGLDFTVLRYSNIYGPRQEPRGESGVVSIFMEKLMRGERPTLYAFEGAPEGMTRDYCYVEDAVKANLLALEGGSGEVYNIGSGVETATAGLYGLILALAREAGYAKGREFDKPLGGPARPGDIMRSCLEIEKARRLLGWIPSHDLESGLKKTISAHEAESFKSINRRAIECQSGR